MSSRKHVFLVGFMGSGKTTIGRLLAPELNRPFVDTDELIKISTNKTIPEIFSTCGEKKFREMETEIITSFYQYPPSVIALGGGAFLSSTNREMIKELGLSIYLKWYIETLYHRLKQNINRPLLQNIPAHQLYNHISFLLTERCKYYEMADIIINGDQYGDQLELVTVIITKTGQKV